MTRVENYCTTGSEALRAAAYAVASGAYDVAMAVGAEKVKDSGYQGLNAFPIPNDGTSRTLTAAAMFSMVAPGLRQEVRRGRGRADRGAGPHLVEEPPERGTEPPGPVPQGGLHRDHLRLPPGGRPARGLRLRRGGRRRGGGHRGPGRGRVPLHRQADLHQGTVFLRPAADPVSSTPSTTTPGSPSAPAPPRTPTARPASPTPATSWPWPRCTTASPPPNSS